jgi:autotransporter-associated beta strand protein
MNGGNDANAFGSGASALTLSGGTLTAKANNPRNFARNTTVSGNCGFYNNNSTDTGGQTYGFGTLSIGACTFTVTHKSGGTVGSLTFGATTLTGDAIFEVSTRSDNLLVLGAVSGNYGMTKTGVGILKLVGDNSYSGETVISNGVLQLDNLASTRLNPEAALNVCANGTFFDAYTTARRLTNVVVCGAGTLMSAVTNSCFVVTGTVAPGDNGIGTLNVATGCVQVATGATYFLEIGGTPDAPVSDSVALSGSNSTVNFDGAWTLNIAKVGTVQPYNRQFVLFDYTGANPPSLGTPTVTYASGTEWYGGQVRLDSANSRIVLTFSTGTMISIF